ncbi:MAG: GntR family transcriptional regulator [Burkholderiales bacterium]
MAKTEIARKSSPPVSRDSSVLMAYRSIRQRILDNVYPAGHRALEQEYADELGLSRTPVREALLKLAGEGLVEVIPRHGARVLPVSTDDMREIYEMLTALEPMAAELLANKRLPPADLKPLTDASRDMAAALKADDLEAWALADERYHRHLIALAGNRLLAEAVQGLWDRAHRARMVTLRLRPRPINSTREHIAIVDAIRAGDAPLAARLYRAHRERGSAELLAILEKARLYSL